MQNLNLHAVARNSSISPSSPIPSVSFSQLKSLPDDQLMAHLQAGHGDALAVLFDRYHRLVLSIALRILGDPGEAEDVMQNIFLEIFRSAAQFDPAKGTTKTWLLQYAYHRSINRREHLNARHFYTQVNIEDAETLLPEKGSVLARFSHHEVKHLVKQGLAQLGGRQRKVLELASYDGLSMNEIAEKTGESLTNVRHDYYRGLKKLRAFISGDKGTKQHE